MLSNKIMELVQKAEDALATGEVEQAKVYAQLVQALVGVGSIRGPMMREFVGRPWGRPDDPGAQPTPPSPPFGPPRVTNLDYQQDPETTDDPEAPDVV